MLEQKCHLHIFSSSTIDNIRNAIILYTHVTQDVYLDYINTPSLRLKASIQVFSDMKYDTRSVFECDLSHTCFVQWNSWKTQQGHMVGQIALLLINFPYAPPGLHIYHLFMLPRKPFVNKQNKTS